MINATHDLDVLFPLPSPPPTLSPTVSPGITRESAEELVRLLKENHVRFHCFFNDRGFHNHLSHHLYSAYHMGAYPKLLQAAFDLHASYQREAYKSPSDVDLKNWKDHLGNEDYYRAYLAFFSDQLIKNGVDSTLEKFFFSPEANWGSKEQDKHPEMLSRLLAGLVHPFIYTGFGMEFGHLGMVAEGFAQAAAHSPPTSDLLSREFFMTLSPPVSLASTLARKLTLSYTAAPESTHPFNLLARVLRDPRLAPHQQVPDEQMRFKTTSERHGNVLREYAEAWDADASSPQALSRRVEELSWVVTLIYGVGGCRKNKPFRADFFTMHLVTSSLFLPAMLAHLSPDMRRIFLRSYFAVVLGYWVSQGRAKLDIANFYAATVPNPVAPGPQPVPYPGTLEKDTITPNPWFPMLQSTVMHPAEHLVKLERALAHYGSLYGTTPQGQFRDTELDGAEKLDGTVFLRVAWVSMNRLGWMREGDEGGDWDFDGFFSE